MCPRVLVPGAASWAGCSWGGSGLHLDRGAPVAPCLSQSSACGDHPVQGHMCRVAEACLRRDCECVLPCQPRAWGRGAWAQELRALPLVGSLVDKSQNVKGSHGDGRCGPWCQNSPGSVSPLSLPSCGIWGQWLCFFVPQFPHL